MEQTKTKDMGKCTVTVNRDGDDCVLRMAGTWQLDTGLPDLAAVEAQRMRKAFSQLRLDGAGIGAWDSALLIYVGRLGRWSAAHAVVLDTGGLPLGARRMLALLAAAPESDADPEPDRREGWLAALGDGVLRVGEGLVATLTFIGEATASLARLARGRARYRRADFWLNLQQCGPAALGIVSIISFLVGTILAFVGVIQLRMFGAEIYIANLVGIGMVVEMGALMTGIILAGRTGASFAAQLGTMQVNEEIDAFRTLGIEPMDYLVLPRMLALALMTPLLVIYADLVGILGGAVVGIVLLDLSPWTFFRQASEMMTLWLCAQGLIKGTTFGVLVALAGCLRGMQCGRSAAAVGEAATSAVVTAILWIVIADAVWTCVFMRIG